MDMHDEPVRLEADEMERVYLVFVSENHLRCIPENVLLIKATKYLEG